MFETLRSLFQLANTDRERRRLSIYVDHKSVLLSAHTSFVIKISSYEAPVPKWKFLTNCRIYCRGINTLGFELQANKLLATETDFWRRSASKSRKGKALNGTVRAIMEAGKNILEVTEENGYDGLDT
jgi:hypothetical protein